MRFLAIGLLTLICTATTVIAETYTLPYQKKNRWVASEDANGLRALIRHAKKTKQTHYYVQLPAEERELSIKRLIVLRDMLEKHLKDGLVIEEIKPHVLAGGITVHTQKPE